MTKPVRVLIIGDSPDLQSLIGDLLSGPGGRAFEAATATTIEEGLEEIREGRTDAVLLAPDPRDGPRVLSVLRRIVDRFPRLAVIVLSTAYDQNTAIRVIRAGAQDYVADAGADPSRLVRSIRHAVERKRAEDRVQVGTWEPAAANKRPTATIANLSSPRGSPADPEQRWRNLFDATSDAVIVASTDGNSVEINDAGLELLGLRKSDSAGLNLRSIFDNPEELPPLIQEINRRGAVRERAVTIRVSDGTVRDCLISAGAIRDESGVMVGYQGIIKDITTRKRLMDKTLDSVTDGVFIIDAHGKITYFNAAAEKILGITQSGALKRHYTEVIYGPGRKTSPLIQSWDAGLETTDQTDEFVGPNKTSVPVSLSVSQLSDTSGLSIGTVVTFRDLTAITELKKEIDEKYTYLDIVSKNRKMREIFDILPAVAESESTVLIEGKSGTGKELVARAIHNLSPRRNGPFVAVNCAAIPESLIESELFGYVRGAFTDAVRDKIGRFAAAGGGTILLDEIGELAKPVQVKLVRVLEQRQYEPLGSVVSHDLDVRIICSTNRDLGMEIGLENFREDLYYRINVITISLPELWERPEDIPLLAAHFVKKLSLRMGKPPQTISDEVMDALIRYDFPGNVRQLENIIERMLVVSSGGVIGRRHLPAELLQTGDEDEEYSSFKDEIEGSEKKMIQEVLNRYRGNRGLAARALNINRTTLWRKMQKHNLLKDEE